MVMTFHEQRAIEILKSLVEISISGFRTLALLNGGGAIALVSYLGHANPIRPLPPRYVIFALGGYVFGLFLCGCAYITSHGTQLHLYNETVQYLNNVQNIVERHRAWLLWARLFVGLSLIAFFIGSGAAVFGFVGGIKVFCG